MFLPRGVAVRVVSNTCRLCAARAEAVLKSLYHRSFWARLIPCVSYVCKLGRCCLDCVLEFGLGLGRIRQCCLVSCSCEGCLHVCLCCSLSSVLYLRGVVGVMCQHAKHVGSTLGV